MYLSGFYSSLDNTIAIGISRWKKKYYVGKNCSKYHDRVVLVFSCYILNNTKVMSHN